MNKSEQKEEKFRMPMPTRSDMLANERVGPLLLKLSVPAMIGMMVQAFYNVIDAGFVGRYVGTLGIGGIAIVMPIHLFIMSIGMTIGMGSASIISRRMGAGNRDSASLTLGNMVFLSIIFGISCTILGMLVMDPLIRFFGANNALLPYCKAYLKIILMGSPAMIFCMAAGSSVRAEGSARVAMVGMLIGAILNIILDAVFIVILDLGIRGAAFATVLSMITSMIYLLIYYLSGKSELSFRWQYMRFNWAITRETFAVGSSDFARSIAMVVINALLNSTLRDLGGEVSIAAFGIFFRILSFFFMPMMGIAQGAQPIMGFNYGANQIDRVKKALRFSNISTTAIGVLGFFIFMIIPGPLLSIFSKDPDLIAMGKHATRLLIIGLPLVGYQNIATSFFQALGKAKQALLIAMLRQIVFFLPMIIIMPILFGLDGVWISLPISDILSFILTFILVTLALKKLSSRN